MMFQSYALFPHLNCLDNVAFSLKMRGVGKAERHAQAREFLTWSRMEHFADRLPAQLSGGQQQRVALARALITEPPRAAARRAALGARPVPAVRMREELKRLQRELGITFIHVTHRQDEAMAMADLMVVMAQGAIEQAASAREVFDRAADRVCGAFHGRPERSLRNRGERRRRTGNRGRRARCLVFDRRERRELVRGSRLVGSIRRDRISVNKAQGCASASGKLNSMLGEVHAIEYQGSHVKLTIERPSGEEFVANIVDEDFFRDPLDIGDSVLARWSARDVLILEGTADAGEASMDEAGGVLI